MRTTYEWNSINEGNRNHCGVGGVGERACSAKLEVAVSDCVAGKCQLSK